MKHVVVLVLLSFATSAYALDQCPYNKMGDQDKLLQSIRKSSTCKDASALARSCSYGNSLDQFSAGAASSICRSSFQGQLYGRTKSSYDALNSQCETKYRNLPGPEYLSSLAFCQLKVNRLFAELYSTANSAM